MWAESGSCCTGSMGRNGGRAAGPATTGGRASVTRRVRLRVGSTGGRLDARIVIGTVADGSWRCVGLPGWTSVGGWSRKVGRSRIGGTRMRALARNWRHGRRGGACGPARSFRLAIGARASALAGRGQRLSQEAADGAASRATSAQTARASTMYRVGATTGRRGNGGSAPKRRHERRDVAAQGNSPHPHRAAHRRQRVRCAGTVAGGWNRPLGRYQTFPGARMQLHSNPLIQSVNLGHVRGGPLARLPEARNLVADDIWIRRTRPGRL